MSVLALMPVVSSVDSEYKFNVSIKSNELDNDDIEIIPIEASNHKEYGQKAVEFNKNIFLGLLSYSYLRSIEYIDQYADLNASIVAWENNNTFTDFIDEFKGIKEELNLPNLERVLFMGRLLADFFINMKGCTTTGATNKATSSGDATLIHQNIDSSSTPEIIWTKYLSKTIRVAKIDGEYDYAFWSYPVLG